MDEYLFITLARLKADRLKLQREQRRARLDVERVDAQRVDSKQADLQQPDAGQPDPEQLRLELDETVQTRRPSVPRAVRHSVLARWFSQQPLWREQS